MIYTYFVLICVVILGGLTWYICNEVMDGVFTWASTEFPAYFTGSWFSFLQNWWVWMPLVVILIPVIIWVVVQSQREKQEGVNVF